MTRLYGNKALQKQGTHSQYPDNLWKSKYKHLLKLIKNCSSCIHR